MVEDEDEQPCIVALIAEEGSEACRLALARPDRYVLIRLDDVPPWGLADAARELCLAVAFRVTRAAKALGVDGRETLFALADAAAIIPLRALGGA